MYRSPQWGTVNLGVDVLQGHGEQSQPGLNQEHHQQPKTRHKQQYNPGRNQELNLPADIFPMNKMRENPFSPSGKAVPLPNVHERIKELIGEGMSRKTAVARAKSELSNNVDVGTINTKQVMAKKYQAEVPWKKVSPFSEQVQGYPFI